MNEMKSWCAANKSKIRVIESIEVGVRFMKYDQLREDAPSKNIESLIKTFVMSLVASGRTEVRTASIAKEIEKRYNINVPYGALMDILNSLPIVDDANEMNVSFGVRIQMGRFW